MRIVSKTRINSANRTKLIVENKVKDLLREQDDELMASGRGEISDFIPHMSLLAAGLVHNAPSQEVQFSDSRAKVSS